MYRLWLEWHGVGGGVKTVAEAISLSPLPVFLPTLSPSSLFSPVFHFAPSSTEEPVHRLDFFYGVSPGACVRVYPTIEHLIKIDRYLLAIPSLRKHLNCINSPVFSNYFSCQVINLGAVWVVYACVVWPLAIRYINLIMAHFY